MGMISRLLIHGDGSLLMSRNNNGLVFPILNDFRVLWILGSIVFGFWISFSGSIPLSKTTSFHCPPRFRGQMFIFVD